MTEQNDYLADDARQVEPGELVAFNVPIVSLNARANELVEMLRFVQDAATFGVAAHIERARYDSTEGICHIDVNESSPLTDRIRHQLLQAARKHLARFTLCGINELGESLGQRGMPAQAGDASGYPDAADNDDGAPASMTTDQQVSDATRAG